MSLFTFYERLLDDLLIFFIWIECLQIYGAMVYVKGWKACYIMSVMRIFPRIKFSEVKWNISILYIIYYLGDRFIFLF